MPENNNQATEEVLEEVVEEAVSETDALKNELNAQTEKYMRILAEYDNFRKRSQKEKEAIYPRAVGDTVEKFLPIIDNFERAMSCECSDENFKKGMDMIFQSFMNTLKGLNVEIVGEVGETFNPELHNAVMHIEDENYGENQITQVLQKGYKIGDRVVRYAMVQVAN